MECGTILIVEDEAISALDLKLVLEQLGYKTTQIATTGEEAVALAGRQNPDVVLMDINIDGEMDGIQAAEKIRSAFGIPVIFMTGYSDADMMEKAKKVAPAAILNKPLDIEMVKSAVKAAIKKSV